MHENQVLSISQFAAFTGVSRSTLIYYDEIGLFSPVSRGDNNYRYYSPKQIITINFINVLRDLSVPVKEIRELVRNRTPENINDLMMRQDQELKKKIRWLRESQKVIRTVRNLLNVGIVADEDAISVDELDELPIMMGRQNDFEESSFFYEEFIAFCRQAKIRGRNLNYPIGGYFDNMDVFLQLPSLPTRFFFVNPDGEDLRPAGRYLTGYTRGYYGRTNDLPARMVAYAKEHSLVLDGPVYNIYLLDEISVSDPDLYLLQVTVHVS
ncbi:MAG: MerR family DNA-binding transcriptional regulator [Clostridiales Family XIII bacterium]|jgi:DNA-binding transcriptional MerR regulator|nr:MerR family DNA-binding transcriptional regulator [Clostridiales Family XIII bacterium]